MVEEMATRRLVALIANHPPPDPPPDVERAQRQRLLSAVEAIPHKPARRLRTGRPWVVVLPIAAAFAVAVAVWLYHWSTALTFVVTGKVEAAGSYLSAQRGPGRVGFSDGSELVLDPGTRLHVQHTDPLGATVLLERGVTTSEIVHRPGSRWLFTAGPFEIRITGTRFRTSWDPSSDSFEILVENGSVVVRSQGTGAVIPLKAGDHLRANGTGGSWILNEHGI